jgi:prepilin-type N-terminal cleavage/methylation domain-containing protein/prepilin-type processing-associated H-X9-DG protein
MRKKSAFTLIELLVVIAIIALLMAILMPTLGAARKHARAVVCQSNLKQWGATLALYTEDHQGRFPTDHSGLSGIWLLRGACLPKDDPNANTSALHGFGTGNIALCPMAAKPASPTGIGSRSATVFGSARGEEFIGTTGSRFTPWEILKPAPAFRCSYGYNQWAFRDLSLVTPRQDGRRGLVELDVFSLRGRAAIPVLLDSTSPQYQPKSTDSPPLVQEGWRGIGNFCMNRHSGYVNGLFLDWSVRPVGLKEIWTLKWYREFNTAGPWTKAGGVKPENWPRWMRGLKDY